MVCLPKQFQRIDLLREQLASCSFVNTKVLVLDFPVAQSHAHNQAPATDHVQCRVLLSNIDHIVERQYENVGAYFHLPCLGGKTRQQWRCLEKLVWISKIVLRDPQSIKSCITRCSGLHQVIVECLTHIGIGRMLRAKENSNFHHHTPVNGLVQMFVNVPE